MNISTRDLEKTGAGVIREDLVKKTVKGKIYNASIYRNNKVVNVIILYYRRGGNKVLDITDDNKDESIKEYMNILRDITNIRIEQKIRRSTIKELRWIKLGTLIGYAFTLLNITAIKRPTDLIYVAIDILLIAVLRFIYKIEERRYD